MLENDIILKKIDRLSDPLKQEALDFIDFLTYKNSQTISYPVQPKTLNFDWENALSSLKTKYSALQLQKKSLEWR